MLPQFGQNIVRAILHFWSGSTYTDVTAATPLPVNDVGDTVAYSSPAPVAVGTGTTPVLAANTNRKYGLFINDGANVIYLMIDGNAQVGRGIRLNPNGGSFEMSRKLGNLSTGAITAIAVGAATNLIPNEAQ